ncbi:MAG: type II toxin-antitoxin system HicA family toxin [Phycisphaerae bacterium]
MVRRRGSHVQVRREEPNGTAVTFPVPVYLGRTIKRGTLSGILRKAGMDVQQLRSLI